MAIKEPPRSSSKASLLPPQIVSSNTRVVAVKKLKPTEPQEKHKVSCRKDDGRPLKSLHWKALDSPVQGLTKRHKCEAIPDK